MLALRSGLRRTLAPLTLLVLLAGCGGDGSSVEYGPADELGPFAIGITTLMVDDGEGTGRTLPVEVWYPASPAEDAPIERYELSTGALEITSADSPNGAVRDAPADLRDGPYPVVVFSHGNGGVRIQSVFMTEHLASHGFVVAAPEHVGNTLVDQVTGDTIPVAESARLRPIDVSRTLDAVLEASEDADGPLEGAADSMRVGVAGHSFGGYTALRVAGASVDVDALRASCMADPSGFFCEGASEDFDMPQVQADERFGVALAQAPGGRAAFEPSEGLSEVVAPTMVQGATADMTAPFDPESRGAYERLGGPASLLGIEDAGHFSFSDMCRLLENANPALRDIEEFMSLESYVRSDGCGEDNIPWPDAHAIANEHATAFFHTELAGREGFEAQLDPGAPAPDDIAVFETR